MAVSEAPSHPTQVWVMQGIHGHGGTCPDLDRWRRDVSPAAAHAGGMVMGSGGDAAGSTGRTGGAAVGGDVRVG